MGRTRWQDHTGNVALTMGCNLRITWCASLPRNARVGNRPTRVAADVIREFADRGFQWLLEDPMNAREGTTTTVNVLIVPPAPASATRAFITSSRLRLPPDARRIP